MPVRRLKVAVRDHRRQSFALANALHAAGHLVNPEGEADALLIDFDPPGFQYGPVIKHYHEMGAKIILYPHGAGAPTLSYDGLFDPDPRVNANLVVGVGHAEFLRRIEYPKETFAIGWYHGERRPFRAATDVKRVVFGPTHPNGDGSMMRHRRELNTRVYEALLKGPWELTVQHVGKLEDNGLWPAQGVRFVSNPGVAHYAEIDRADAVVAGSGTFPTLAIARGVPTVIYGQATLAWGLPDEEPQELRRGDRYLDYIKYPLDFEDGPLDELLHTAARSEAPVAHWKRRFLGEAFEPLKAVEIIEKIVLEGPRPVRVDQTRSRTTLAFADELAERPQLLARYAASVGPDDDATLVLWAPAVDEKTLLAMAEQAIAGAGLADDRIPDVLLTVMPGSPEADATLAERADTLLSEWPSVGAIGALPRFGAVSV